MKEWISGPVPQQRQSTAAMPSSTFIDVEAFSEGLAHVRTQRSGSPSEKTPEREPPRTSTRI